MVNMLQTAIEKIKSVGDRTAITQKYYFDDFECDEMGFGDPTALCNRLGIPVIDEDELYVEYPVERTFVPLSRKEIAGFEKSIGASLPDDYKTLLSTFGAFHLPGPAEIILASPESAISLTLGACGFDDQMTMPVLAVSPYHVEADGNCIGFRRCGEAFGPELFAFDHDLRYKGDDPSLWTTPVADSFAAFIVSYVEGLDH